MITLNAEFKTRTFAGLSECKAEKHVFDSVYDIERTNEALKWAKNIFTHSNDVLIDFTFFTDHTHYVCRITNSYRYGKITVFHWDGHGNVKSEINYDKVDIKLLRKLYNECANAYTKETEACA